MVGMFTTINQTRLTDQTPTVFPRAQSNEGKGGTLQFLMKHYFSLVWASQQKVNDVAPLIKIGLVDKSDGRYDDYPGQHEPVLH